MFSACLIIVLIAVASRDAAASRPLYEAPLLTPLVAPKALAAWQPREWAVVLAPSAETRDDDTETDDTSHDEDTPDDVTETIDETDHRSHDDFHPSSWRRFFIRARDVDVRLIAASVAVKREGWTGASVSSNAQFSLDG